MPLQNNTELFEQYKALKDELFALRVPSTDDDGLIASKELNEYLIEFDRRHKQLEHFVIKNIFNITSFI